MTIPMNEWFDVTRTPWVSVEDKLPDCGCRVLAYFRNMNHMGRTVRAMWIAKPIDRPLSRKYSYRQHLDEGWHQVIERASGDHDTVPLDAVVVTHWMPLPPPPEDA